MAAVSNLEAVKIQARAVIPIVRALEARIGVVEAHQLVGDAIANAWADHVQAHSDTSDHPRGAVESPFPVERVIARDSADEYAVNMTRCGFADYFRSIGAADVGALLTCGVDYEVERRLRPDWTFTRTQTLMQGASHCDFCWRRKNP